MKVYPVEIDRQYSAEFQTDRVFAQPWKQTLARARAQNSVVTCCCGGDGNRRLAVRYYEESDSFGLARYPLGGEDHANDCRFYAPTANKTGFAGYTSGVVKDVGNGTVKIRLDIGVRKRAVLDNDAGPDVRTRSRAASRRQSRMTLLGLLHYLWESAGINTWRPGMEGKRDSGLVNAKLRGAAAAIQVGKINLDNVLLLSAPAGLGKNALANQERVTRAAEQNFRLLLVAPLAAYKSGRAKDALSIVGFGGIPFLDMCSSVWDTACARFPRAVTSWQQGHRLVVIAQVELKQNMRYANVMDLALMSVTDNWIPVDSAYEHLVSDKLTAERRSFIKPLRFDSEDTVFPDFILRDTGSDTPLEVFGRSDEPYEVRKAEKEKYYRQHFGLGGWWCWNAVNDPLGEGMAEFPARHGMPVSENLGNDEEGCK